jgi:UDP-N-acetylmuramyl pentapeptide phosphotransferase/UDP-N-acetylglucosamine-1-phosphate transferase
LAQAHLKRSMPSLIGGIFSGIVVFALWLLLFDTSNVWMIVLGVLIAGALGTWIRLADL